MPETLVSYAAPTSAGFDATVTLPGSKSLTNRELVLSARASEPSELIDPLISRDTKLMMEALGKLGARFEEEWIPSLTTLFGVFLAMTSVIVQVLKENK